MNLDTNWVWFRSALTKPAIAEHRKDMRASFAVLAVAFLPLTVSAGTAPDGLAVLKSRCFACHNDKISQGKLNLTTRETALKGGDRGPAIVSGDSKNSLVYQFAGHQVQPFMPPAGDPISPAELKTLAAWIDAGAAWTQGSRFESSIKPLLEQHCVSCHHPGAGKAGGLDLTSREKLIEGGDHGSVVTLNDPEKSVLIARLRHAAAPGMPFNQPQLPAESIAKVVDWLRAGAPYDAKIEVAVGPVKSDHWAFQKPEKAPLPKLTGALASWSKNPVDILLAARWQEKGLQPSPEADRRTLLRRVYIDLTGLPPTPAEIDSFLSDRSPDAYEKVVDSLLESPRYGERWGRHWMDIWRYSDWYGRRDLDDQRNSVRHIWHWRDWIIESLNADKGYDRMIKEMIAGDEIAPNNPDVLRATGFLARNYYRFNRNFWMQDTVEHIGFGILGLTMKCARCHDHKYDPISQEEYYKLRAFFEPYDVRTDRIPGHPDTHEDGISRIYDSLPHEGGIEPYFPAIYKDTFRLIHGDESNPDKTPISPGTPAVLGAWNLKIEPVSFTPQEHIPDLRDFVGPDLMAKAREDVKNAETALRSSERWLERVRAQNAANPAPAEGKAVAEKDKKKPSVTFADIQPILNIKCKQCHGGSTQALSRSGLMLTSEAGALQGGYKYGPAVIPGRSAESPLIRYISGDLSPRMPVEGGPVTPAEEAKLAKWIDEIVEEPAVTLRKAEERVALAKLHLESAKLYIPALDARLAADREKYLHPAEKEQIEKLGDAAQKVEQKYTAALASEEMLEAQQLLSSDKAAAAKTRLEAAAKALGQSALTYSPAVEAFPATSTGRRTALAEWLTSRDNPLPARVAVNDIWLRHFGKPIVATVSNFGKNGAKPTDQRLLDWLAVDFMDNGWSMKKLHRLLLTSKAYRMASSGIALSEANRKIDPDNKFFWHMNPHRMEAETVRDAVLYQAGLLDLSTGGPEIEDSQAFYSRRRSLYLRQTPDSQAELLRLFDQPVPTDCYVRTESIIPQQALAGANSTFFEEAARLIAKSLNEKHGADDDFIRAAFDTILGAPPTVLEQAESRKFLASQSALLAQPVGLTRFSEVVDTRVAPATNAKTRAREDLIHALLNHNEFIMVR
jgi:mono/diheme cytochrome c family protein